MKKVLIVILSAFLVLSPTVALIGCYFYFQSASTQVVGSSLVSAVVTDHEGNQQSYDKGNPFFSIFSGMFGNGEENKPEALIALPSDALNYSKYAVRYKDNFGKESSFTYYLSADPKKCYYTDENNHAYRIAKPAAEAFLNSDYAEVVYALATPPVLSVGDKTLVPYTVDWNYKTIGGVLKHSSKSYSDKDEVTSIESFLVSFLLDADLIPDEIHLQVKDTDNGATIFEGAYEDLAKFVLEGSRNVSVEMTAVWKNTIEKAYAGSAKYYFKGKMYGNPAFSISASEANCGEVVILNAYNVMTPEDISVKIEPSLNYTPVFYKVGDNWQALLPLSVNAVESGDSTFSITMNTASASDIFLLKVSALEKADYTYNESKPKFEPYYNDASISALRENMKEVALSSSDFSFAGGKFVVPTKDNYYSVTSNYAFGTNVTLAGLNVTFTALDTMYCAQARSTTVDGKTVYIEGNKTKALAAFDGKVVYVGSQTYTGRLVVIDHGSGLKTWYSNLSSDIQVKVGDTVKAGDVISSAADGGLNATHNFNFHVGATVHGVPVNIQPLIDKGLIAAQD